MADGRHLGFDVTGNSAIDQMTPKTLTYHGWNQTWSRSDDQLRRYRRFFLAHAHLRHISTSGGSSGGGFRIADSHFLLNHHL